MRVFKGILVIALLVMACGASFGEAKISVKSSPLGKSLFDVYVRTSESTKPIKFSSIRDLCRYGKFAEYHNGNLYVIVRPGGDDSHNPNMTEQLWRYDRNGKRKMLFSCQGFEFRVKPDETMIAVFTSLKLTLLHGDGSKIASCDVRGLLSKFQ